ncbi:MAG TPA: hypothetical protein DEQ14_08840 [Treponema sp.]|nr:hypothetical protein [Treponema sp.]
MKNKINGIPVIFRVAALATVCAMVLFSCASAPKQAEPVEHIKSAESVEPAQETAALLPLSAGWYQYDFEKLIKCIEDEYMFNASTGMQMVSEITWKYTGVVCRFEDGVLYDPIAGIELAIDGEGRISCAENVSIRGKLEQNGDFWWSGQQEENGRLNSLFTKGTVIALPPAVRGGREYNGVYHLTDSGSGREQLVNIADGFYTWNYLDGEEAGFTPWPTLVHPDGSIRMGMEITTVMAMGDFAQSNYSTGFSAEGTVTPGKGISMQEVSRTTGMGIDQAESPQVYAGTTIRAGEFPNEAIPADIADLVRSGRASAQAAPKPNPTYYPSWYLNLPEEPGYIYAAGEKTFDDKDTALAMASAAAAAAISEQVRVRIASSLTDISTTGNQGNTSTTEERIALESSERLRVEIVESTYNEETRTAFVLARMGE